jgi:hypothetical protein
MTVSIQYPRTDTRYIGKEMGGIGKEIARSKIEIRTYYHGQKDGMFLSRREK